MSQQSVNHLSSLTGVYDSNKHRTLQTVQGFYCCRGDAGSDMICDGVVFKSAINIQAFEMNSISCSLLFSSGSLLFQTLDVSRRLHLFANIMKKRQHIHLLHLTLTTITTQLLHKMVDVFVTASLQGHIYKGTQSHKFSNFLLSDRKVKTRWQI